MGVLSAVPWPVWPVLFGALCWLNRRASGAATTGRVVGIVGRMGSGKSYFAVRMAYSRMKAGATVYSNFSMRLGPTHDEPCGQRCVSSGRCRCKRHCPCQMASRWHRFEGWEQFVTITDAVVIIDEVDLYAPSHDPRSIPDYVRFKLKMARKHRLDIYWIAQHESRVHRMLRDVLTNEIRTCQSWFGGLYFSAKTWDPSSIRRRRKHTGRSGYFMRKRIANLYDTLETIRGDTERGDGTMAVANAMADVIEAERHEPVVVGRCTDLRTDGRRRCPNRTYGPDAAMAEGARCPKHGGHDPKAARAAALLAAQAKAKAVKPERRSNGTVERVREQRRKDARPEGCGPGDPAEEAEAVTLP